MFFFNISFNIHIKTSRGAVNLQAICGWNTQAYSHISEMSDPDG